MHRGVRNGNGGESAGEEFSPVLDEGEGAVVI